MVSARDGLERLRRLVALMLGWRSRAAFILTSVAVMWGELAPQIRIASPWDKGAHMLAYCALATLLALALRGGPRVPFAMAGLIAIGAGLEFLQRWTGRDPSVSDAAFNAIGACAGWLMARAVMRRVVAAREVEYLLLPANAGRQGDQRVLVHRSQVSADMMREIEAQLARADADREIVSDMGWQLGA